jgi:uncharacterized protein YndB with AHSA1/START domain
MGKPPLVVDRILPAPPDVVFAHWSDPRSLALWMRPEEGMREATVDLDFRVGGKFEITMHGDADFRQQGRYVEIEPDRKIVMEWISEWMPEGERHTRVTVTFEASGDDATRLTLIHEELPASDAYDGHEAGWAQIFECLHSELRSDASS